MIKELDDDLELPIINQRQGWSLSFAPCLWDLTRAGIRSNSTFQISREEHMERTTLRLFEFKSTRIAGLEEFTFPIDFIQKTSFPQNSNYSYPSLTIEDPDKPNQALNSGNKQTKEIKFNNLGFWGFGGDMAVWFWCEDCLSHGFLFLR